MQTPPMTNATRSLPKGERLHSKKLIEQLFSGGGKAMSAFPLRLVYMPAGEGPSQMLVSVPKRLLHRANKRNRVKRQVREAYRKNKHIAGGRSAIMAFIWLDGKLHPTDEVERHVARLLTRMKEKEEQNDPRQ